MAVDKNLCGEFFGFDMLRVGFLCLFQVMVMIENVDGVFLFFGLECEFSLNDFLIIEFV